MVSRAFGDQGEEYFLHTGQHYSENMSQLFFVELNLPKPDINLGIGGGSHAEQTSGMLLGIDRYLEQIQPDWVIVYGDTNSTLAGALAAAKTRNSHRARRSRFAFLQPFPCRKRSTASSATIYPLYCSARQIRLWIT